MMNPNDIFSWNYREFENVDLLPNCEVYKRFASDDLEELANQPKKWKFKTISKIDGEEVELKYKVFRSNYKDNKTLDGKAKIIIEDYKRTDYQLWRRYRLGLAEEREELIFKINRDYKIQDVDLNEFSEEFIYGLDFGFSKDPTACVKVLKNESKRRLYVVEEVIYSTDLTNQDIASILLENDIKNVVCDSAEPKSIEELKRAGVTGVMPATKGAGSIVSGIKKLKGYEVSVSPKCTNLIEELQNYRYKKDKNGNVTSQIVDDYNHLMDALRYSISNEKKQANFY